MPYLAPIVSSLPLVSHPPEEEEEKPPSPPQQTEQQEDYITEEEAKEQFEKDISAEKEKAKQEFQSEIEKRKQQFVSKAIENYMINIKRQREAAGYHLTPQEMEKARREALQKIREQVSKWEEKQWKMFEEKLSSWEQEQRSRFEDWLKEALKPIVVEQQVEPAPAKSYAQQILEWPSLNIWDILGLSSFLPQQYQMVPWLKPERDQAKYVLAGFVGSMESLVYGISDLAGFMIQGLGDITGWYDWEYSPLWHPSYPPTVTGAFVTSGIESAMARQLKPSYEMQQLQEMWSKHGATETILYGMGSVAGDILQAYLFSKAFGLAKKGASKVVGSVERYVAPEHYYYYKNILQKPMIRTMTKQYIKGTLQQIIGEETYQYLAKIGLPSVKQAVISSEKAIRRAVLTETPLGEVYYYSKLVAAPYLKSIPSKVAKRVPQILGATRSAIMGTPFGEPILYAKSVLMPNIHFPSIKLSFGFREAIFQTPIGEAWLYGKSVLMPNIKLPKVTAPYLLKRAAVEVKGTVSGFKLYGKSLLGKKYVEPMPKIVFSSPMKPWSLPRKTVVFEPKPIKPIPIKKGSVALTITSGTSYAAPSPSAITQTAVATTILHGWKGAAYPFRFQMPRMKGKAMPSSSSLILSGAFPVSALAPKQSQIQRIRQRQLQQLKLKQRQIQIQKLKLRKKRKLPKMMMEEGLLPDLLGTKTGVWEYPIATPRQALSILIMGNNKRRGKA